MKIIALALITLVSSWNINAQNVTVGPTLGLNYSSFSINEDLGTERGQLSLKTLSGEQGMHAGAYARIAFHNWYVQPQILYSQHKTSLEMRKLNQFQHQTLSINKLEIPVLMGYAIQEDFRLLGGMMLSYIIDASILPSNASMYKLLSNTNSANWGYQLGLGYDVSAFSFDLKYSRQLAPSYMDLVMENNQFNISHHYQTLELSMSYLIDLNMFGKAGKTANKTNNKEVTVEFE